MTRDELIEARRALRELVEARRQNLGKGAVAAANRNQRRAAIAEQFQPGASVASVAVALGVSKATIRADFSAMEWPKGRPGSPHQAFPTGRAATILAAVKAEPHRTLEEFGKQYGVSREYIRQILARWNFTKVNSQSYRAEQSAPLKAQEREAKRKARQIRLEKAFLSKSAQAMELRASGKTYKEIAAEMGVTAMTAYRCVNPLPRQYHAAMGIAEGST